VIVVKLLALNVKRKAEVLLLYTLHFCRTCGEEYYGMRYDEETNEASPWTFQDDASKDKSGYYSPKFKESLEKLPENWLTPKEEN
jgi:hypothetical protein